MYLYEQCTKRQTLKIFRKNWRVIYFNDTNFQGYSCSIICVCKLTNINMFNMIIYTLSHYLNSLLEPCVLKVEKKKHCHEAAVPPKAFMDSCGGQSASDVRCRLWPLSQCRVKAKVMLRDFHHQPPRSPSRKTPGNLYRTVRCSTIRFGRWKTAWGRCSGSMSL